MLLLPAAGERVHGEPAGDAAGPGAHHGWGLAPGHGAPAPGLGLAPVLHRVLGAAGCGAGDPHHLFPGLLRLPHLQQVPAEHLCAEPGLPRSGGAQPGTPGLLPSKSLGSCGGDQNVTCPIHSPKLKSLYFNIHPMFVPALNEYSNNASSSPAH